MSIIDKRATELLIENGVLVADTLRHLADNEIDSDYFAICHTNENGTEIECELAITDYARQAAGTVDELVKALEAAEKRIAEQREIMLQSASDISYAIFNLTGSDLSRLNPGVVETTDPTDTALIAERNLRAAAAGKGE